MPDVHVNQTNQPPTQPPPEPPRERTSSMWPVIIIILVIVLILVWFIFARGERTEVPAIEERTNIEIEVPEVRTPEIEVPDRIEVDVPDRVDVDVNTSGGDNSPPPNPQP
jgi:hypothetical protein